MLPIILIGAGIAALLITTTVGFGLWGKDDKGQPIKEISLGVLGPKASGKTLLFYFLKTGVILLNKVNTPVGGEKFEELIIKEGDKTLKLKPAIDISGADASIVFHYDKILKDCNHIFFVFNCHKFLTDENDREYTLDMVEFINRHNLEKKLIIFLGSHVDQLLKGKDTPRERELASTRVMNFLKNELDSSHINELVLINMLSLKEMNDLKKGLFK